MAIVFGTINENGGITINSGQITSAERSAKGSYKVNLASGTFTSTPIVLATVMTDSPDCGSSGTNRTISVTNAGKTELCFGIRVASAGDEASDRPFSFVAYAN